MTRALPLLGLAGGTTLMVLGSSQLSAVWMAKDWPKAECRTIGAIAGGMILLGTVLQALSSYELGKEAEE